MKKVGWIVGVVVVVLVVLISLNFIPSRQESIPGTQPNLPPESKLMPNDVIDPAQGCINSGGNITSVDCYCSSPEDFFNTCLIGACTCTPNPEYKRTLQSCNCGPNSCFDGSACVARSLG